MIIMKINICIETNYGKLILNSEKYEVINI